MNSFSGLDSQTVQIAFTSALRRHVGLGKTWSAERLSEASGIPLPTIKSYQAGGSMPSLGKYLRLSRLLDCSMDDDMLHLAGKGGVSVLADDDGCVIEAGKASAEVTSATMGLIRKGGGICSHEVRKIIPMAQTAVRRLSSFIRKHGRTA